MSARIVDVVRKLQRLAKSSSPAEAALARARAIELQERYRVHVSDEDADDHQIEVEGVAGTGWRERVLAAVGRQSRCRVLRHTAETKGQKKRGKKGRVWAVLSGARQNVEAARDLYFHLSLEVARLAVQAWRSYSSMRPLDTYLEFGSNSSELLTAAIFGRQPRFGTAPGTFSTEGATTFFNYFHNAVAKEIVRRLDGVKEQTPPRGAVQAPRGSIDSRQLEEVRTLAEEVGTERAASILRAAENAGENAALRINWIRRGQSLLAVCSTFPPPPPPTRFSQLEIEID